MMFSKEKKESQCIFYSLAINPEHFERAQNILMQEIRRIYSGRECTAERILALVGTAMNRLVVDYVRSVRAYQFKLQQYDTQSLEHQRRYKEILDDELEERILKFSRIHHLTPPYYEIDWTRNTRGGRGKK